LLVAPHREGLESEATTSLGSCTRRSCGSCSRAVVAFVRASCVPAQRSERGRRTTPRAAGALRATAPPSVRVARGRLRCSPVFRTRCRQQPDPRDTRYQVGAEAGRRSCACPGSLARHRRGPPRAQVCGRRP
jgi:hypothetical protein